jgi:hypothetical protein
MPLERIKIQIAAHPMPCELLIGDSGVLDGVGVVEELGKIDYLQT